MNQGVAAGAPLAVQAHHAQGAYTLRHHGCETLLVDFFADSTEQMLRGVIFDSSPALDATARGGAMNSVIYLVGLVVVVIAVLSFVGLG